ncbi:MAG: hypothetical protein AAFZ87_07275 [Planctomycetota bacterium]
MSNLPQVDAAELGARIAQALEHMCFIISDPVNSAELPETDTHSTVSVGDEHPLWDLSVSASNGLLTEIACGLMGIEPSEMNEDEVLPATVQELANIFSGIMIEMIGGEEHPYHPGIPELTSEAPRTSDAVAVVALDAMGDGLLVTLNARD